MFCFLMVDALLRMLFFAVVEFDIVSSQAANRRKDILLVDMAIVSGLLEPSLFLPMRLRIRAPSGSGKSSVYLHLYLIMHAGVLDTPRG